MDSAAAPMCGMSSRPLRVIEAAEEFSVQVKRLLISRGECEEALSRLREAHEAREITDKEFFPLSNRGVVIIRMINALLH